MNRDPGRLVDRLKSDFLQEMFIPFLFKKECCSVVAGMGLEHTRTKHGTSAFALLGDFEIFYPVIIEEITNNHFSLRFAVCICFVGKADIYPGVKKG